MAPISPIPNNNKMPYQVRTKHNDKWISTKIDQAYAYKSASGEILGYVIRYMFEGKKETPPFGLFEHEGKTVWSRKQWWSDNNNRPLYNLDRMTKYRDYPIVIVEGEKCADMLQGLFDAHKIRYIATTWIGGTNNIDKADWTPVSNRKVLCWADNDQPGITAMRAIATTIRDQGCTVSWLVIPDGKPHGWDCADAIDEGLTIEQLKNMNKVQPDWAKAIIKKQSVKQRVESTEQRSEHTESPNPTASLNNSTGKTNEIQQTLKIKFLGYNKKTLYFMSHDTNQITDIDIDKLNEKNLSWLSDPFRWKTFFADDSEKGIDWKSAINYVMAQSKLAGVFTGDKMRGRGVWLDIDKTPIIHCGDVVYKGNDLSQTPLNKMDTEYTYERGTPIIQNMATALPTEEAKKLLKIMYGFSWKKHEFAEYLAGWCAIAPMCGALTARPHIWMTGSAGSGKTYIINNVIKPCLGGFSLDTTNPTTASGIRQHLGKDSLPVLCDEFEDSDIYYDKRVQDIITLARQSFSDSEANILKGTPNGKALEYKVASSFFFSSISRNISTKADETRITVLELGDPVNTNWEEKQKFIKSTITRSYCNDLRTRMFKNIQEVRQNSEIISIIVGEILSSRRLGDSVGPLVAGAYTLQNEGIIDYKSAEAFCKEELLLENQKEINGEQEELQLLYHIMSSNFIYFDGQQRSPASLIEALDNDPIYTGEIGKPTGDSPISDILAIYGIRYRKIGKKVVCIAGSNPQIKKLMSGSTRWKGNSYYNMLRRIGDVTPGIWFAGIKSCAIVLPLELCRKG